MAAILMSCKDNGGFAMDFLSILDVFTSYIVVVTKNNFIAHRHVTADRNPMRLDIPSTSADDKANRKQNDVQ
jgi:hypothetical protein